MISWSIEGFEWPGQSPSGHFCSTEFVGYPTETAARTHAYHVDRDVCVDPSDGARDWCICVCTFKRRCLYEWA